MVYPYNPDYSVSPGEVLKEILDVREWTYEGFSESCGWTKEYLDCILEGKSILTPKDAEIISRTLWLHSDALSELLFIDKDLWLNLEKNYRQAKEKKLVPGA